VVATPKPVVATPVPTPKPLPVQTPLPTATATPVPTPTATPLPTGTPSPTATPAASLQPTPESHAPVAKSLRVQSATPADRGIFETVIGSLLNFLLG
jgi:hypothetical protein